MDFVDLLRAFITPAAIQCGSVPSAYTERMDAPSLLDSISLELSPAIEAYKSGIDRALLRENLRLTPAERVEKMIAALRFAEAVRDSRAKIAR
jgi:hypothetical protein